MRIRPTKTKPQISLEEIPVALLAEVAPGVVMMDASYGSNSALRKSVIEDAWFVRDQGAA